MKSVTFKIKRTSLESEAAKHCHWKQQHGKGLQCAVLEIGVLPPPHFSIRELVARAVVLPELEPAFCPAPQP